MEYTLFLVYLFDNRGPFLYNFFAAVNFVVQFCSNQVKILNS